MDQSLRNVAIFAPVDAGKTTLTERMLYLCGAIRRPGSVGEGTTVTDNLPVERDRGITVRTMGVRMAWQGTALQLMDTPGHGEFAAQAERALWAIDGAVVLVDAADGVAGYTRLLAQALAQRKIPFLFFANKMDRPQADLTGTLEELAALAPVLRLPAALFAGAPVPADVNEALAELDDGWLAGYVEGREMTAAVALALVARLTLTNRVRPVLWGSAVTGAGVEELLTAVVRLLPSPRGEADAPVSGVVFGLEQDRALGRGGHVRLYRGSLAARQAVLCGGREGKVSQIRPLHARPVEDTGRLTAGQIGVVFGLPDCRVGDVIGDPAGLPRPVTPGSLSEPLLSVAAAPARPEELPRLRDALTELTAEDPLMDAEWSPEQGCFILRIMGAIQLEVLAGELERRFGLAADFSPPAVLYRETPAAPAEGFVAYTMPKPCWAVLRFYIQPLPRGTGVRYDCAVSPEKIPYRYRRQVEQTLPLALSQGVLGWPVTDVSVTLVDGEDHPIHTHPLDFAVATPMAVMDGLSKAGSILLEPMLEMTFTVPASCAGAVMQDMDRLRGRCQVTRAAAGPTVLTAVVPAATTLEYAARLAALTGGHGTMTARLAGYEPCPLALGALCPRRSVDPRDTARYILAARKALSGSAPASPTR